MNGLHTVSVKSLKSLKEKGFNVDCQRPEGGIYISVYLGYVNSFSSTEEYISFLINNCGLGIVPFEYFGSKEKDGLEFRLVIFPVVIWTMLLTQLKWSVVKSTSFVNSMIF